MFDERSVSRLNVPFWEGVYRSQLTPDATALIAVHDTSRGWALGGCRMSLYDNEAEALTDVLRLSRGMSFKNAVADLPLGGGKSVLVCDPKIAGEARNEILKKFGHFLNWVNRERERYRSAEDMNTTVPDMKVIRGVTDYICGDDVDPSPVTAYGVFCGIERGVEYFAGDLFGGDGGLQGKRVLVQGLGKVGMTLVDHLADAGAQVLVSDIRRSALDTAQLKHPEIIIVEADEVMDHEVDVFAPCARGEVVTKQNLDQVRFKLLCGAANNQLQNRKIGDQLHERGVVYCPDYVANMGGVCSIQYEEIEGLSTEEAKSRTRETVRRRLDEVFNRGLEHNLSFDEAVDGLVTDILWKQTSERDFGQLFPAARALV